MASKLQERSDRLTERTTVNLLHCRQTGTRSASNIARQCCGLPQTHLQLSEDRHPCQLGTLAPSAISLRLGVTRAALELSSCSGYR